MTKTLVDIDDVLLTRVAQTLGTTTKKDTVNAALKEVLRQRAAVSHLEFLKQGALSDLLDDDVMKGAWR